jgi:hypothetical protein
MNRRAGRFEGRTHERDCGTFAVRPSHMDGRRQAPLRIIERSKEPLDTLERKIDPLGVERQ